MTKDELYESKMLFIKSKTTLKGTYSFNINDFVIDSDTPNEVTPTSKGLPEGTRLFPLSMVSYPEVLKRMTAMEAGLWALNKCISEKWDLNYGNVKCCLANLEMDF